MPALFGLRWRRAVVAIKITGALRALTICCSLTTATSTGATIPELFAGEKTWSAASDWGSGTDASPAFTPDGKAVYFTHANGEKRTIMVSHLDNGVWSNPKAAEFSGQWRDLEPAMAPDGTYLIFVSNRPVFEGGKALDGYYGTRSHPGGDGNLWRVDRRENGWSQPVRLPDIINSNLSIYAPAVARSGTLYFMQPDTKTRKFRLYRSVYTNGAFETPEALPFSDGSTSDFDPAVAPDESFIIFSSSRTPLPEQQSAVFVAFAQGSHLTNPLVIKPILLGTEARLSPDLGVLYFTTDHPSLESAQEAPMLSARPTAARPQRIWDIPLKTLIEAAVPNKPKKLAIMGATLIDLSNFGRSTNDLADSAVLIDGGKITAVEQSTKIPIPSDATRIDARGKFLVPGLIDGFGALRNQAFANAYLYDGVTTVYVANILPDGGGDGEVKILRDAALGPHLFLGAPMTGYSERGEDPSDKPMTDHRLHDRRLTNEQLVTRVNSLADQGYRGVTISYDVWPDQVDTIVAEAKRRGLATLAELGFTSYPYGIMAGINVLLRDDSYQLELAPATTKLARADDLRASRAAYRALCATDPASSQVANYGQQIAESQTALMPMLAMEATADSLDVPNPWAAPSAALINAADLDTPVDRATGASGYLASLPTERRDPVRNCGWHKEDLDSHFYRLGAKFLAGSITPSYGVMPGSGLRLEIELLHRIGLS